MINARSHGNLAWEGMTMVVTHEMGFKRRFSPDIFMDEGRIIEEDPRKTFLAQPESERTRPS
jgi:ABC-type polar amino acid transport system ATPase subunit